MGKSYVNAVWDVGKLLGLDMVQGYLRHNCM